MSGTNAGLGSAAGSAAVTIDPQSCNALTQGPNGLLVPATAVEGVAPGTAVGTGRSVDVDVTAPAAGDCPQEWQVGARLTPAFGEEFLPTFVDLVATASGDWINTGLSVVLPEAGVYEVTAAVHTVITTNPTSGSFSIGIVARLFDVTAGGPIADTLYTIQQNANNNPTSAVADSDMGTFQKFVQVAGATTVRLEAARIDGSGTPIATTGVQVQTTRLAFKKIAD
ncbi:hypothetical protein [Streptomyces sp. NPDC058891]|uniref:hypothetical protein n=1 Tax=Streptomyces sp. NPDC058891 TaxID=3346667 RepID=UPI0036820CDC